MSVQAKESVSKGKGLSFFEKYLTLWVVLCIAAGVVLGKTAPRVATFLDALAISVKGARKIVTLRRQKRQGRVAQSCFFVQFINCQCFWFLSGINRICSLIIKYSLVCDVNTQ